MAPFVTFNDKNHCRAAGFYSTLSTESSGTWQQNSIVFPSDPMSLWAQCAKAPVSIQVCEGSTECLLFWSIADIWYCTCAKSASLLLSSWSGGLCGALWGTPTLETVFGNLPGATSTAEITHMATVSLWLCYGSAVFTWAGFCWLWLPLPCWLGLSVLSSVAKHHTPCHFLQLPLSSSVSIHQRQ